jgi:hypothetical protein
MELFDKYKNLKKAEKDFLWAHPLAAADFNSNATTALKEAQKRFSSATLHNGSGDAFRHCFWSAMNARDQGKDLATMFGIAHEDFVGNPQNEKAMDLHNNSVGFEIGSDSPGASDRHLAVLCAQAWSAGKLIQMNAGSNGDLIYSNSTEKFMYGGSQ